MARLNLGQLDLTGQFGAVDAQEVSDALAAQTLAQRARQRIVDGVRDVAHTPGCGVEFVGRAHRADERHLEAGASAYQFHLGSDSVDAVDNVVILREVDLIGIGRQIEHGMRRDAAAGIDGSDALGSHINLETAHIGGQRDDLPIDVRQGHRVVVKKVDGAHAAASQHLDGIAAHATHAEDGHAALGQAPHRLVAQQHLGALEQRLIGRCHNERQKYEKSTKSAGQNKKNVKKTTFLGQRFSFTNKKQYFCGAIGPDGGIGRRVGLKHQWGNTRAGSTPALGTKQSTLLVDDSQGAFFFWYRK